MNDMLTQREKENNQELRMRCIDFARSIRIYDNNGETKLSADDILDAAKKFYEFVK